jgi:hypothetical protein
MEENQITIIKSGKEGDPRNRLLIMTPTLGVVRIEWSIHRYCGAIPCNWSASSAHLGIGNYIPMHYLVADAQNLGCAEVVKKDFEWFLLWEDDVIPPLDALLQLNKYIIDPKIPVVSGLYFTKGHFTEPILYRGLGNSCFTKFKLGDKVWADGVPTGFLLIHSKVIKLMYEESEDYTINPGIVAKKIFETPARIHHHPETDTYSSSHGTSDLAWCHRVIDEKVLQRAGWPKIGRKKYPFLCDTNIFCKHIHLQTGKQYPCV